MAKYQKYEEYKESGVEWLSQLPVDWNIERTKRMLFLRRELVGANSLDYQLLSLTLRGVIPRDISNGDGKIPADFSTYQEVEKKDLIFCLFDIDETPRTVGLSPENGMITGAYNVYKTSDRCSSRYAYYYFLHIDLRKGLRPFYTGLRKVVRSETFGNIKMPCPSDKEQTQIANFLDYETAQIDTLIDKQQTLIQLLKEKRQAVISHAVTKGLNPNAPMKDSGVEWLGDVPEHWSVSPLKLYIDTRKGVAFKSADFADSGVRVVKASDIKEKTIRQSEVFLPTYFSETYPKSILNEGDIVISTVGSTPDVKNSAVGQIGMVPVELDGSLLNQNTVVFSPRNNILENLFLFYLIQTDVYRDHLDLNAHGTANQASLNVSDMLNFTFARPSFKEQSEISKHIVKINNSFDALEKNCVTAIQLMQERRTALISAAVTGKIDVRGWQAP